MKDVDKISVLCYFIWVQASIRLNDILLVFVVISSMAAAIIFPDFGSRFKALPFYCLMINFFLSYLSIDLASVWKALKGHSTQIFVFTVMKLAILPVIIYFVFHLLAPDYALSALLLTGVSAGVVAPMISNMVRGNSALVLVVVVITSALAPFTLPALIKMVAAKEVTISFLSMLRMLATVVFIPIVIVEIIRYLLPRLVVPILKIRFPVSLLLFALINLGVFYRYAPFFKKEPSVIIMATVVAFVLAAIYCVVGILFFRKGLVENQLAGAVMLGNINNVLVIVFSSEFFGPVEPLVAAMYMIPFFVIVIPLRYYYHQKTKTAGNRISSGPVRAVSDACFVVNHAVTIMTNMNTQSSNNEADEGKSESGVMVKTTFSISKMDCPSEERMIRMKLEGLTNIESLRFDIPGRTLELFHTGRHDDFLAALDSLHLDTKLVSSEPADIMGINENHRLERRVLWQVLAINFFFFTLEMLTGFIAGSMGLVADSLDMLADSIVYALSLFAVGGTVSRKKNIAGAAGYFQLLLALLGFAEVIRRFAGYGETPNFYLMIIISLLALAGNMICLFLLQKSKSQEAHMQASMIFTSNDVIVNLGVIVAGVAVYLTASKMPDLIVGTIVFMLVGKGAYRILQLSR